MMMAEKSSLVSLFGGFSRDDNERTSVVVVVVVIVVVVGGAAGFSLDESGGSRMALIG